VTILKAIWGKIEAQPVGAQGIIVAGVALGTSFGLGWTGEQVGAVTGFSAAVIGFLVGRRVPRT
jgi:hypothetical protein